MSLQCTEEAHRPVDCGTVAKWILKNSAESENMNWYFKWSLLLHPLSRIELLFLFWDVHN